MFDLILVALLQAMSGDPAQPAETSPQASEAAAATPQTEAPRQQATRADNVRCRREPILGSRTSQRVCTTAAQDAEMRTDARQMINRAQSQGRAD
jgi:hypothetical protein